MPNIMPVSDLQRNFKSVIDACSKTKEPLYLTRNGYPLLVIMNADAYEEQERLKQAVFEREMRVRARALRAHEAAEAGNVTSLQEAREQRARKSHSIDA